MSMTESGLRLCAPNAEVAIAAVRALSEGRERRRLVTVPYKDFTAPVARAKCAWEDISPVKLVNTVVKGSRARTRQQFTDYKATKPGKFTSHDFALWAGIEPTVASTRLSDQAKAGRVERCGKAGRNVIWRFV